MFVFVNQSMMQSIDIYLIIEKGFCLKVGKNNNKQIFHAFLFNIRNYSPEVIGVEYYVTEGE